MVEGSKFRESHVLKNTKLGSKGEEMPQPLVVFRRSLAHLTRFRHVSYLIFNHPPPPQGKFKGPHLVDYSILKKKENHNK
jgi:hypothetical protein